EKKRRRVLFFIIFLLLVVGGGYGIYNFSIKRTETSDVRNKAAVNILPRDGQPAEQRSKEGGTTRSEKTQSKRVIPNTDKPETKTTNEQVIVDLDKYHVGHRKKFFPENRNKN